MTTVGSSINTGGNVVSADGTRLQDHQSSSKHTPHLNTLNDRGRTEISGASHSHAAGHPPDRTARVFHHNDTNDDIIPPDPIDELATSSMKQIHIGEAKFVNSDISPDQRAAREQQGRADRKYQQTHSVRPETADKYELTDAERQNLYTDALHHNIIDARKSVKHEIHRELKHINKGTSKLMVIK